MFKIVKVRGESMRPTLAPGDYLIITKARSLRPGFIYVVDHPELGNIVKRLDTVENGRARFSGDGSKSNSPDIIGHVPVTKITGRARFAVTPRGIKRL